MKKMLKSISLLTTILLLAACQAKEASQESFSNTPKGKVAVTQEKKETKPSSSLVTNKKNTVQTVSPEAVLSETQSLQEQQQSEVTQESSLILTGQGEESVSSPEVLEQDNGEWAVAVGYTEEVIAEEEVTWQTGNQLDAVAIANGDFTSLAGTWVNSLGESVVFDQNGLVAHGNASLVMEDGLALDTRNGVLSGSLRETATGFGAGMFVVPAGEVLWTVDGEPVDMPRDSRDYIEIGHSLATEAERYYRQ